MIFEKNVAIFFITFFLLTLLFTGILRVYALKVNIIDLPNERSSHSVPTPRGGGIAIVISFLLGLLWSGYAGYISLQICLLFFVAGFCVALIGWFDDRGHVDAKWRLLVHFCSAILVVYACGGLPILYFLGWELSLSWFGHLIAVVALVWILNLYNFMDGIDGLAGGQAVISTLVMGLLIFFLYDNLGYANLHWLMSVSALGFLFWNFPRAKIFMGDAGSGFLGLMLGALLLSASHIDQSLFWSWLVMLGIFIVDATFTLLRRLLRGEKIYQAHCSHAYQYASKKHGNHRIVTLFILIINLLWLAPVAYLIYTHKNKGLFGLVVSYAPLVVLAFIYKAGANEGTKSPTSC